MADNRKRVVAAIATVAVLAAAPSASAGGVGKPRGAPGPVASAIGDSTGYVDPCGVSTAQGQGGTGVNGVQICQGGGQAVVGPQLGQSASVVAPTIVGPATVGNIAVNAGDVNIVNG